MHPLLLDELVALCKRRVSQGDCPTEPAASVESLEHAVVQLSSYVGALAAETQRSLSEATAQMKKETAMTESRVTQPEALLTEERIAHAMLEVDDPLQWGLLRGNKAILVQFANAIARAALEAQGAPEPTLREARSAFERRYGPYFSRDHRQEEHYNAGWHDALVIRARATPEGVSPEPDFEAWYATVQIVKADTPIVEGGCVPPGSTRCMMRDR